MLHGITASIFLTDPRKRGLDFLLKAGDQLVVGPYQRLLGINLGDDGLLGV